MYNLPVDTIETGRDQFWETVRRHFRERPIDILEIGVFQGKCINSFPADWQFRSYTGVDPYLGTKEDRYTGSYWKNPIDSKTVYLKTQELFDKKEATLVRATSEDFFKSDDRQYDFIFVDADHSYSSALWDMCKWFSRVKDGGLMMVDDYGNIDTRDVTKAVNSFFAIAKHKIGRMGFFDKSFINTKKYIPIVSRYVFFEKNVKRMERFSYNDGSSARNIPIAWSKIKKTGILSTEGVQPSNVVVELCRGYVDDVVDLSNSIVGNDWNRLKVWHLDNDAQLSDWFFLIPHLGTIEIEHYLQSHGLKPAADFFTLSFPANEG